MPAARKLTSTRRCSTRPQDVGCIIRSSTFTGRILGYDARHPFQTLLHADGLMVRRLDIPTRVLRLAGVSHSRPDVLVRVAEFMSGGLVMHFESVPRVELDDLPHPIRTIIRRERDFS